MTQKALGEASGLGQSAIGNYEAGLRKPSLESARRIVKALRDNGVVVTLDDVFEAEPSAA